MYAVVINKESRSFTDNKSGRKFEYGKPAIVRDMAFVEMLRARKGWEITIIKEEEASKPIVPIVEKKPEEEQPEAAKFIPKKKGKGK